MNVDRELLGHSLRASGGMRLRHSLAQQIGVQILSGEIPEGYYFPGEVEYAEQIGISRSALREAFRTLAAKGLVDCRPKAGTCVRERRAWSLLDPDILAWQFMSEPRLRFVRDMFELRMVIEPAAARMAASRRSPEQVATMRDALDRMGAHSLRTPEGRQADQAFHAALLEATCNEAMIALNSSIMAAIAWTTIYKHRKHAVARDPLPEHLALLDAVEAADPDAAHLAMAHLIALAQNDTEIALALSDTAPEPIR